MNDVSTAIKPDLTTWHCVEAEFDFTGRIVNAWFDDGGPFTLTLKTPKLPYDLFSLALSAPEAQAGWFDELAFDTKRVGCP